MSPRGPVLAATALATLLAGSVAGCQDTTPETGAGMGGTEEADGMAGAEALTVTRQGDGLAYRMTVLAPDACFRAEAEERIRQEGERLIVERRLMREPGICAQVMTPVTFAGEIALPAQDSPTRLTVEIFRAESESDTPVSTHEAPIPR